jgi:16S rRNA processing protein RimM
LSEREAGARLVVLGKIVGAHGLRGEVKVYPFADDPAAWGAMPSWRVGSESDALEAWRCLRLIHCRNRSGVLIAALEGLSDRDAAESLHGMLVGASREELPATENGEYYWDDLVGLEVENVRGRPLGRVAGLIKSAANDVLRVENREGGECLLPFVDAVVREVDVPGRRILVDWEADW